jgi:hypothetical protein
MALSALALSASSVQPLPRPDVSRPDGEPVVVVAAASRAWTHPGLIASLKYTNEAPLRYRERFEAGAVYQSLVSDGELE